VELAESAWEVAPVWEAEEWDEPADWVEAALASVREVVAQAWAVESDPVLASLAARVWPGCPVATRAGWPLGLQVFEAD
jgi:hypothetical protein